MQMIGVRNGGPGPEQGGHIFHLGPRETFFRVMLATYNHQDNKMADKYTLNWQTFSDHLQLMFKDLYEEKNQSDVTLVCDDQTQFKAHKIVDCSQCLQSSF